MADGKWIDLEPGEPVVVAARRVLSLRLGVVRDSLPLAVHEADRDIEHVHRLRVSTRRAGAALKIFEHWLPNKVHGRVRRTLRGIRRAAGEARDWDVFADELLRLKKAEEDRRQEEEKHETDAVRLPFFTDPGIDFLVGYAAGQRDAVQVHLVEAGTKYGPRLDELTEHALETVRDSEEEDVCSTHDLGRVLILELMRELNEAARADLHDYEHLHQMRILGKQLRYVMEVFASCFPPAFREEVYPRVEEMQELLGMANDSHVACGRLTVLGERMRRKWPGEWDRYQPALDVLLTFHRERLPRQRDRFLDWWQRWKSSDSQHLRNLLSEPVMSYQQSVSPSA